MVSFRSWERPCSSAALRRPISRTVGSSLIPDGRAGLGLRDRDVGNRPRLSLPLLDDQCLLSELRLLFWRADPRLDGLRLLSSLLLPFFLCSLLLLSREVDLLLGGLLLLLCAFVLRLDGLLLLLSGALSRLGGFLLRKE